ncbi:Uncharacterised protein [Mycobacteroides abscessus subsp. abscessus]|uniref:hypothetical protein n=1 Tax=Mycobacteroides abscessus TaxID=36809 RepID=UPI00092754A5|nr:hypothetical protein [Mycobacteroides abscessus]SIA12394.1 Uncharacterised protein [Mycobacteroides abscessus subsp. abscessus]
MSTAHDIQKPDDQFGLVADNWPVESESAYAAAERQATAASNTAQVQAQEATDAATKTDADMKGKTAESVSNGYSHSASQLHEQSVHYNTVSAWMADARGVVAGAKRRISTLVRAGTSEIREALTSEVSGTAVTPSSADLIAKYRADIDQVAAKLGVDLDAIGHSLAGAPGASRTPSYTSVSTAPTPEHADPHVSAASYTGDHHAPAPEPHELPPMPRATTTPTTESPSTPGTPSAPIAPTHAVNPTLSNLVAGSTSPSGTPSSPSAKPASTSAGQGAQASQPTEQHQDAKSAGLPRIPSIPLPNAPAVAADIATAVSSSVGHQLATTAPSVPGSSTPVSTGFTPGTSGTPPVLPAPPGGLSPIGGGLPTPPVMQAPPASQGTPASPPPGVQTPSAPPSPPAAPRGPVVDAAWIQRTYGLSPSLELPKPETTYIPALFITELPDEAAHLHRALATIRHQFEGAGWGQPLAVATIRRGFESCTVYVTSDGLSLHPHGVLLPHGVTPLDEMPNAPTTSELLGSLMVSEKLTALIPRTWEIEQVLSTVPGGEDHQSVEQYQELVDAGELLNCNGSRGRDDVTDDEALSTFARAALGSAGCGELEAESTRLRAARWIGVQPQGYVDGLSRWYLADAAESMSAGRWGEAVYSSEKYLSVQQSERQAA